MDFAHSERTRSLMERLSGFMRDEVAPAEAEYAAALGGGSDWRRWRQPAVMETLKSKAKQAGLWNLFLPDAELGAGLANVDYAPLAEIMGHSFIAPKCSTAARRIPATWRCSFAMAPMRRSRAG